MFKNLLTQRDERIKMNTFNLVHSQRSKNDEVLTENSILSDLKSNLEEQMKYNEELELKIYQSELDKKRIIRENLEKTKNDLLADLKAHSGASPLERSQSESESSTETPSPRLVELEVQKTLDKPKPEELIRSKRPRPPKVIKAPVVKKPNKIN